MSYRITNRTSRTVLLRLRSGQTLHLGAGARTDELDGAEINGNPRIASLVDRNLVAVEGGTTPRKASAGRTTGKKSGTKSGNSSARRASGAGTAKAGGSR